MARYIDADKLKERLEIISVVADDLYGMGINRGIDRAETEIDMLPTADVVEVKHGYWEIVKGSNGKEKMVCTNCRHQQDLHSTFTYCPNCGALIDGIVIHNG